MKQTKRGKTVNLAGLSLLSPQAAATVGKWWTVSCVPEHEGDQITVNGGSQQAQTSPACVARWPDWYTMSLPNITAPASCHALTPVLWTEDIATTYAQAASLLVGGAPGPHEVANSWVTPWDLSVPSSLHMVPYLPTQCCMKSAKKCVFARKTYFQQILF